MGPLAFRLSHQTILNYFILPIDTHVTHVYSPNMDREIRIREVAEEIHREAKKAAIDSGVSLNAWIIEAIKQALPKRKPASKSP
jgi:hypothetical protein